ncbi:hypothetical protein [Sulfuritalea sp.]|nr:hypothetical protein [Sulfuritalea sp.]
MMMSFPELERMATLRPFASCGRRIAERLAEVLIEGRHVADREDALVEQ